MGTASEAIVIRAYGGPDVMKLEGVDVPAPSAGELLVRQHAASVNFHDIYVRSGSYRTLDLPGIPGLEAVGTVEAVGEGVTDFAVGDRIAYIARNYGGYARARIISAALAVPVPAGIDDGVAAAWFLKGLTAQALVEEVEPVRPGMAVLDQAAGGGVGQLVARMARLKGGRVIGTAGSTDKAAIAMAAGCDEVILYREEDVAARVLAFTGGEGVGAAYDAVGADTFEGSLASLAVKGHLVHYGQASGPIPPFDLSRLGAKSAKVSRPFLWPYISKRETLLSASEKLFAAMAAGAMPVTLGGRFELQDAAKAHAALESRAAGPFVLDC
jgi:NADPH2:quinone reductase